METVWKVKVEEYHFREKLIRRIIYTPINPELCKAWKPASRNILKHGKNTTFYSIIATHAKWGIFF